MRIHYIASALFASVTLAAAQPAPEPAPTPPPAGDPAPPPTTEPTPPTEGPVTTPEPLPPEPPKDEKPAVGATYDGGLKLSSADEQYELKLQFRNQLRFESVRPLDGNQFLNRFYLPRIRLQAEGFVFGKSNRYKLEFGLGDAGSFAFVKDVFVERKLADAPVWLRMGVWKRPFNRAEIVSDFASTFNERSIQNELAGGGRDIGVAVHNDYEKSPEGLEWVAGVFNGFSGGRERPDLAGAIEGTCETDTPMGETTGAIDCSGTRPANFPNDFSPAVVLRVGWNSAKMKGYSEGDLEGGGLRYGVGLAYKIDLVNFSAGSEASWGDNLSHGVEVDALVKVAGFQTHLGAVMMKLKTDGPYYGVFAQPGYMLGKKDEIALRFAYITGGLGSEIDRDQIEARLGYSHFFHGHTIKLASDAGIQQSLGTDSMGDTDQPDFMLRVMMQLSI